MSTGVLRPNASGQWGIPRPVQLAKVSKQRRYLAESASTAGYSVLSHKTNPTTARICAWAATATSGPRGSGSRAAQALPNSIKIINQSALPSSCQSQPYSIQAGLNIQTWVSCGYAAVKLSLLIQRGQRGLSPKDTQLHHNSAEHEQCPCGLDVTRVSLTAQKGVSPRTPTYSLPFRRACKVSHSRGLPVCRCRRSYCTAPCLRPPRRVLHVA